MLGLGATIVTNKRKIEGDKFFTGLYETALEPGELITSVVFPVPKRAAYHRVMQQAEAWYAETIRRKHDSLTETKKVGR